jgi:hypothetical protein
MGMNRWTPFFVACLLHVAHLDIFLPSKYQIKSAVPTFNPIKGSRELQIIVLLSLLVVLLVSGVARKCLVDLVRPLGRCVHPLNEPV